MAQKDKKILKLEKMLEHWADHNESHKKSFLKWRDIAEVKGLLSVAGKLDEAVEFMDKCTAKLLSAHQELKEE